MIGRVRKWRGRSRLAQVDLYTRATLSAVLWIFAVGWVAWPLTGSLERRPVTLALGGVLIAVCLAQAAVGAPAIRQALDHYLGRADVPRRRMSAGVALTVVNLGLMTALETLHGIRHGMVIMIAGYALLPVGCALAMVVPLRVYGAATVAAAAVGGIVVAVPGADWVKGVVAFAALALGGVLALITCRPGAWSLKIMWEADEARSVQARLAVAEERLRFSRDMHDVVGRNLAVIALKSELAVRLARRGRPEAAEQMDEVQRIARESQREMRDVVRAYRQADLQVELAGARAVLGAAGVECLIEGEGGGRLPEGVQSTLGWVIREGTTNVLRHADARTCRLALRVAADGGAAVLTMENDGVPQAGPGGGAGSGIAGLRERLAALGGTLVAEPRPDGRFRLRAQVPLDGVPAPEEASPGGGSSAAVAAETQGARLRPADTEGAA
ncbi:sensor histidine kinase [Streptomyces sp. NPDC053427]|uniref:sensor histidine kinase n=1 Tax=Streptomyces sp. NPDC053427 TaxID=3365701 RepID=UPI0037D43D83